MDTEKDFNLGALCEYLDKKEHWEYQIHFDKVDIDEWQLRLIFPTFKLMSVQLLKELEKFVRITYIDFNYEKGSGVSLECYKL